MLNEFKVLKDVINKLNENNIPYMISGSVAMNYYSTPRMTRDIDIVVEIKDAQNFYEIFKKDFYIDLRTIESAVSEEKMFNIIHLEEIIKIDFIIRKNTDYRKTEFLRKKLVKIDDLEVFLVSIEDLIISKLWWAKDSHSEIQLKDIQNLLKEKPDMKYINKWTRILDIRHLLKKQDHNER